MFLTTTILSAMLIGLVASVACFFSVAYLKRALVYDDSLDAFGVHGVGGLVGAILTGLCAAPLLGGFGSVGTGAEGSNSILAQVWIQTKGSLVTVVWSAVVSLSALYLIKAVIGLRVEPGEEDGGLDLGQHGEEAYIPGN